MKTLARLVTACCAAMLVAHTVSAQELSRPYLQGKWEGVMTGVGAQPDGSPASAPPFDPARGQLGFRLEIRPTNLVMYFQNGDQWIPVGDQPGQDLRTNENRRTGVVITGLGAEIMMLNLMRWKEDEIAVHMSRVAPAGPDGVVPPPINLMGILARKDF